MSQAIPSHPIASAATAARDDDGMAAILSTIRQIIDEEPIAPRLRAPLHGLSPQTDHSLPASTLELTRSKLDGDTDLADDVLAELLAPSLPTETGTVPVAPASPLTDDATAQTASPGLEGSSGIDHLLAKLMSDLRGGAAQSPVVQTQATADAAPQPARPDEAVAQAIAAVAAVSAAAHLGGRQRSSPEPAAPADVSSEPLSLGAADVTSTHNDPVSVTIGEAAPLDAAPADMLASPTLFADSIFDSPSPLTAAISAAPQAEDQPDTTAATESLAPEPLATTSGAPPSFEDTIRLMLQPLLREWIEANLPRLLEASLQKELLARASADVAKDLRAA